MLDEKDLLAIGQLMDQKLSQQKKEILAEVSQQIAQQKEEIINEAAHRMQVLLDTEVRSQFNLLAEEISIIREKMMPESSGSRTMFGRSTVRQMKQDIRALQKAQ